MFIYNIIFSQRIKKQLKKEIPNKVLPVFLAILLIFQTLSGILFYPPLEEASAGGAVISKTDFGNSSIGNATFSRIGVKSNFDSNSDDAADEPTWLSKSFIGYRERIIPDLGDDSVYVLAVDQKGNLWGFDSDNKEQLYYSANGTGSWVLVKDFGKSPANDIKSIFRSQKSGYIFIGTRNKIWRSTDPNGTDNFVHIHTLQQPEVYAERWSWTDSNDGYIWIAEYGDKTYSPPGDNISASKIYRSADEGGSWTEIFDAAVSDGSWSNGMHLHKIIYNPLNDTLYTSHGDAGINYLYKINSPKIANSFDIIKTKTPNDNFQPTSAAILNNGNIFWGSDERGGGFYHHDVGFDTLTFIKMTNSGIATTSGAANLIYTDRDPAFVLDMKKIDNTIYAGTQSAIKAAQALFVFDADDYTKWAVLDTSPTSGVNLDKGFPYIAGSYGNYVWATGVKYNGTNDGAVKYKKVSFITKTGLAMDIASANFVKDPWFANSGGWNSYTNVLNAGGKYKDKHAKAMEDVITYQSFNVNANAPYILTFWAKLGNNADTSHLRFNLYFYDTNKTSLEIQYARVDKSYLGNGWGRYIFRGTSPANAATVTLAFSSRIGDDGKFHYVDGIQYTEGDRDTITTGADDNRGADKIVETVSALPSIATVIGAVTALYPFDAQGTYTLWEGSSPTNDSYYKLVVNNGQVLLKDENGTIIATTTGIPAQYDWIYDTYYWAIVWDGINVHLHFASQRSDIESLTKASRAVKSNLTKIYDGSSHTAGEEIGGTVIFRGITAGALTLDQIKGAWNALSIDAPSAGSLSLQGGAIYTNFRDINIALTDDINVAAWLISETQSAEPTYNDSNFVTSRPTTFTLSSGDGTKTVYVWTRNNANLVSNSASSDTIIYDNTPPSVFLSSPGNHSSTNSNKPTLIWTGADANSGISKYQLYINNSLDTDNITGASVIPTNSFLCGNHTWYIRAIDKAGNSTDSDTFSLTVACSSDLPLITPVPTAQPTLVPENPTEKMIIEDLKAKINELSILVAQLKAQLQQFLTKEISEIPDDRQFNVNLKSGQRGDEVRRLQAFLKSQGPKIYPEGIISGWFGSLTKKAVMRFQEKYTSDILAPWGFIKGTGFVGETTRVKINEILSR